MVYVFVQHEVADYDAWKPGFDEHDETRLEYGQQGYQLFRAADDPNNVYMIGEFDSMENAQAFLEESDVREKMAELGVKGEPQVAFLEEIESRRSASPSA